MPSFSGLLPWNGRVHTMRGSGPFRAPSPPDPRMKLLAITDLHDNPAALDRILADAGPVDALLLGGDITHFGSPTDAERLVRQAQVGGAPVLAVAGNCDSAEIDRRLAELGVSLSGRGVILRDAALQGLPAMPPWHPSMYHFSEDELAEHLRAGHAQIVAKKDPARDEASTPPSFHIVLSHTPPRGGRLDRIFSGQHAGSTALRTFIEQTQPALVVCGHIHEARGIDTLGQTTVVNCGPGASGSYALIEMDDAVAVELRKA